MRKKLVSLFAGEGVRARAMRSSGMSIVGFGGQNFLRLLSSLVLTRLLFPEAFGLMALVQVFLTGMQMFSDVGLRTSILQNKRGDDPDFLNTVWTLQILRGVALWVGACALAWPAARLYGEPMLLLLLPVVGLTTIISGFTTTNVATANRHLRIGRQTFINLGCQVFNIVLTVILAYYLRSVWALVIGSLITAILSVVLMHRLIPGIRNRLHWDRDAVRDLIGFGKYIFLSTLAGFFINQGDRAILGAYVSVGMLGIYSIGFFLGNMPLLLGRTFNGKIVLPLYRMKPPADSAQNRANIHRSRRLIVGGTLLLTMILAHSGIWLTDVLYDPRYALSGPIVVLFSLSLVPQVTFNGYGSVLLANGDSRRHFILLSSTAVVQTALLFAGVIWFGIFGAILAQGLAALVIYPLRTRFITRYAADDPKADAVFLASGFAVNGAACWLHWEEVSKLLA